MGPAAPPATGLTEAGPAGSAAGEGDVTKDAEGPADIEGNALAEIEAILARLDRGIAAEHVAMDGLLERISSRLPHDSRTPR